MCPNLFLKGKFLRIIGLKFLYANLCSSDYIDDEIQYSVYFIQSNFHKISQD